MHHYNINQTTLLQNFLNHGPVRASRQQPSPHLTAAWPSGLPHHTGLLVLLALLAQVVYIIPC